MTYNVDALAAALVAAGLPGDCAADGRVDLPDGTSWRPGDPTPDATRQAVAAIVAAHDSTPTREQRLRAAGFSPMEAALLLILARGANAPAWARALVANLVSRIDAAGG